MFLDASQDGSASERAACPSLSLAALQQVDPLLPSSPCPLNVANPFDVNSPPFASSVSLLARMLGGPLTLYQRLLGSTHTTTIW